MKGAGHTKDSRPGVGPPRMGRPEGSLSAFPFLPVTFQSPAGELGAWASKPNSRPTQSVLVLLLYSSLLASVSPTAGWTPPETLQVCELEKVLPHGNKWEALCSSPLRPGRAIRRRLGFICMCTRCSRMCRV